VRLLHGAARIVDRTGRPLHGASSEGCPVHPQHTTGRTRRQRKPLPIINLQSQTRRVLACAQVHQPFTYAAKTGQEAAITHNKRNGAATV
jgi:hypothetical protein